MSLLALMFFYILAAILIFQGLHLFGEVAQPLGTVPEEVGQAPAVSHRWGSYLMTYGALMVLFGALSHRYDAFAPSLPVLRAFGLLSLGAYGAWVVFRGRTVEFMGEPSVEDHGHAHH